MSPKVILKGAVLSGCQIRGPGQPCKGPGSGAPLQAPTEGQGCGYLLSKSFSVCLATLLLHPQPHGVQGNMAPIVVPTQEELDRRKACYNHPPRLNLPGASLTSRAAVRIIDRQH